MSVMATESQDVATLRAAVAALRGVCAQAYQLASVVGAPAGALDVLDAAAKGQPLPHDGEFLPIAADECSKVRELRDSLVLAACAQVADDDLLTADSLRSIVPMVRAYDGPMASELVRIADDMDDALLPFANVKKHIDSWMHTRRD